MKNTTVIFIMVDTEGINKKNLNKKVFLFDDNEGHENAGKPKDYVATVKKNQKVVWVAMADPFIKNPSKVSLLEVKKEKGKKNANILKKKTYKADKKGRVIGQTVNKKIKGEESYKIRLKVGKESFPIDPKLRMNP